MYLVVLSALMLCWCWCQAGLELTWLGLASCSSHPLYMEVRFPGLLCSSIGTAGRSGRGPAGMFCFVPRKTAIYTVVGADESPKSSLRRPTRPSFPSRSAHQNSRKNASWFIFNFISRGPLHPYLKVFYLFCGAFIARLLFAQLAARRDLAAGSSVSRGLRGGLPGEFFLFLIP